MAERHADPMPSEGLRRPTPKSADTRARIVAGALKALEANGIGETTTRRIAAEAGVRLATLHYHFRAKEDVLLAVLDALAAELALTLREALGEPAPLRMRIAGLVRAAWAYGQVTRQKQVVQYELTLYALRTRGSEWLAARQYEAYVTAYAEHLGAGAGGAEDRAARDLARFILAGLDGLLLQHLVGLTDRQAADGLDALIAGATRWADRAQDDAFLVV